MPQPGPFRKKYQAYHKHMFVLLLSIGLTLLLKSLYPLIMISFAYGTYLLYTSSHGQLYKAPNWMALRQVIKWCIYPMVGTLLLKSFFFDLFLVPSGSMRNTLLEGDVIIVNKWNYGSLLPIHFSEIPVVNLFLKKTNKTSYLGDRRIHGLGQISRNDVVVFRNPQWPEEFLVKRCIGLPGDTLAIIGDSIYVNGFNTNLPTNTMIRNYPSAEGNVKQEELIVLKKGATLPFKQDAVVDLKRLKGLYYNYRFHVDDNSPLIYDSTNEHWRVGQNFYFMAGDNRSASQDSRYFGSVPDCYIIGKVSGVVFSVSQGRRMLMPINERQ